MNQRSADSILFNYKIFAVPTYLHAGRLFLSAPPFPPDVTRGVTLFFFAKTQSRQPPLLASLLPPSRPLAFSAGNFVVRVFISNKYAANESAQKLMYRNLRNLRFVR